MADKNIQEGDDVTWNWGGGHPSGTVAEIKTDGQLEIESKGKLVHKNADPSNPAVHVERSGNDVVKRASELTKLNSSAGGDATETSALEEQGDASATEKLTDVHKATDKATPTKKAPRKKSNAVATTGEKRAVDEEADAAESTTEETASEQPVPKKAKTTKADAGEEKKGPGRPRKDSKAKKTQEEPTHAEGAPMELDAHNPDAVAPKKGPGRPKKSDASDHCPATHAPVTGDTPAAHTRSKE
ncbi:hypothetical protein DXG01_001286 [Tephrocybe rancida]|nr:hypothetical protein DXG01_001286 [Tephrocybe rancida]